MLCRPVVGLTAILFALAAGPAAADAASFVGSYTWAPEKWPLSGVSGIELSADGRRFVLVTDRGYVATGTLARGSDGAVSDVVLDEPGQLMRGDEGEVMSFNNRDAEGLALLSDGRYAVSFENTNTVSVYSGPAGKSTVLTYGDNLPGIPVKLGLEGLAADSEDRLYAIVEQALGSPRGYRVWRYAEGAWSNPFDIPNDGLWRATGADFGPDGRLYLLERDYWPILGFMTRVRRFQVGPEGLSGEETLLVTQAGRHDNLEGIAVWQDGDGATRLTLVSDDNFRVMQRTEFVDYRLDD